MIQRSKSKGHKLFGLAVVLTVILLIVFFERTKLENKLADIKQADSVKDIPVMVRPEFETNKTNTNTDMSGSTANISPAPSSQAIKQQSDIPESGIIQMPFTTQSPNADWDQTHEEACEETSLIMVEHYNKNTGIDSLESADEEILNLIKFEEENGYKADVTVQELAEIAQKYYGNSKARVVKNFTVDDIKREVAAGKPVIVPAAGKLLNNPNFRNGGPKYHMLVIKGYDKDGFITNDPGTRKGENFRYSYDNLFNAIHNWDQNDIIKGEKAYLVFD